MIKLTDWTKFIEYLLPLLPPFFGVFLAFTIERIWKRIENRKERKKFLKSIKEELESCSKRLDGKHHLLRTDIWKYGISVGTLGLLPYETKTKLARIYSGIQSHNYEAKRVRDVSILSATTKEKPRVPVTALQEGKPITIPMTTPEVLHSLLSTNLRKGEKRLRNSINELLKQNIWDS